MAYKWGSPEVVETDIRGNIAPKSMVALSQFAVQKAADDEERKAQEARDAARNSRLDYWDRRGMASWQEPDYAGEALAARNKTAAELQLDSAQKMGDIEGGLAETYEPGQYQRRAVGGAQAADALASAAADRYWDPMTHSMLTEQFGQRNELATGAARTAADSRNYVADTNAAARLAVEQLGLTPDMISALAQATKAGMFGTDPKTGDVMAPGAPGAAQGPVQSSTTDAVGRILQGSDAMMPYSPAMEAQIKDAMVQTGQTRQTVINHFKTAGIIK